MSSKVRLLLWNSRVGKWAVGRNVNLHMQEEAQRTGAMLPLAFAKEPRWKKILWLFDHVKTEGSKLYIWREPRRTTKKRSPYVQMAGLQLGRIGKLFTAAETVAWDANRRARERKTLAGLRERAGLVGRARTATARALDAPPQAPRFRVGGSGVLGGAINWGNNIVVQNQPANFVWNPNAEPAEQVPQAQVQMRNAYEDLVERNRRILNIGEDPEDVG